MKRTSIKNRENEKNNTVTRKVNKLTIVFVLLIVIGAVGIGATIFYVNNITSLKLKEDVYQYFTISKVEYPSGTRIENKEMNSIVKGTKENSVADSTPFYSTKEDRIYLSKNYSWYPIEEIDKWRIPEFTSLLEQENDEYVCTINNKKYYIQGGFLVDDMNNYIFLDNGTITVDYDTYDVSKISFYSNDYDIVRIYDYATQKFIMIDKKVSSVKYKSVKGYSIDLFRGVYTDRNGDSVLIISSPSLLQSIEERS